MLRTPLRFATRAVRGLLAVAALGVSLHASAQNGPQVQNAEALFGWAEGTFPALFPQPPEKGTFAGYTFRYYPGSGWAVAVQQGQVYGFHDVQTDRQMLSVTDAVCAIAPNLCQVPPPPPPPPSCERFIEGPLFAINQSTWPTGGTTDATAPGKTFDGVEMGVNATASDCQAMCNGDADCTAWFYEAIGSNFRTLPVCFRFGARTALAPLRASYEGNAVGFKPGSRQIALDEGVPCN